MMPTVSGMARSRTSPQLLKRCSSSVRRLASSGKSFVHKLRSGVVEVESLGFGATVMAASAIANYFVSRHLLNVAVKTDSVALEADAMHLRTDVYTSAGVLGGLVVIKLTGITMLDPIVAIVVALIIIRTAWDLSKTVFFHILDVKLPDDEEAMIHDVMKRYPLQAHRISQTADSKIRPYQTHRHASGCTEANDR